MKNNLLIPTLVFISIMLASNSFAQPYSGTIFIDSTIITSSDPSTIVSTTYTGKGMRTVYDRRIPGWVTMNAYLFNIVWSDGLTSEAQVNPEFGSQSAAFMEADKYGIIIGRLPYSLRVDVNALWIHMGTQPFGGGNNSILIHTGQSSIYEAQGILEETLVHEASHTSLDATHALASGWASAQNMDHKYISTYAASNPTTEDVAESFLTWLAVRQCALRISQQNYNTIIQTIPNRITYFDNQNFNLNPICVSVVGIDEIKNKYFSIYPNPFSIQTTLQTGNSFLNATLSVLNSFGQTVKQIKNISGQTVVLSRDNLTSGVYFIHLTENNKTVAVDKLVITDK